MAMIHMIWTQKYILYGFVLWRHAKRKVYSCETKLIGNESETNVRGNERTESRFQLYEASSDLSHLRVKAKFLMPNHRDMLTITLKNDVLKLTDNQCNTDLSDDSIIGKKHVSQKDQLSTYSGAMGAIMMNKLRIQNKKNNFAFDHYIFDFVVKKEDLEHYKKMNLDIDLTIFDSSPDEHGNYQFFQLSSPIILNTFMQEDNTLMQATRAKLGPFYLDVHTISYLETDVKFRNVNELCKREEDFVSKRKTVVLKNMRKKHALKLLVQKEEDVPNVAIIGSGGGMRAVIGMCGAMTALQDKGVLDCTMYTVGLSGSAWYILSLYANKTQTNPKELYDIIRQKLTNFRRFPVWKAWFLSKIKQNTFSINDSFRDIIGNALIDKVGDDPIWHKQTRDSIGDGSVPLPLIAALHIRDVNTIKNYEWIEISPYEAFIPKYGAAIDMEYFGDRHFGGFAIKEKREICIRDLLEISGSGFAVVRDVQQKEGTWQLSWSGIKNRIDTLFNPFITMFNRKVPNWLRGVELKPLFNDLDFKTDRIDTEKEEMMLVDAGMAINSPYPTVLNPSRKTNLIISFDFSERVEDNSWPFEELEKAAEWARDKCVPFPDIYHQLKTIKEDWEKGIYKEVYIFKGKNTPTIVHFVLINNSNDAKNDFKIFPTYSTKRFKYSKQDIEKLKLLVEQNVEKNGETIYQCIAEIIEEMKKKKNIEVPK